MKIIQEEKNGIVCSMAIGAMKAEFVSELEKRS